MLPLCGAAERVNSYAIVTYIPDPLGSFLDELRKELEPCCLTAPRAHVTVLPPRALATGVDQEAAWRSIESVIPYCQAFCIRPSRIEVFPETNVVYLAIAEGTTDLIQMHLEFNGGALQASEPFEYHPHITLAQNLQPGQAAEIAERAQRRWDAYAKGSQHFPAETFTFVQNTVDNKWIDLAEFVLSPVGVVRR